MKSNKIVRVFGVLFFVILLINISAVSAQEWKESSNQLNSASIFIPSNTPWASSEHTYLQSETIPYYASVSGMEFGDYVKYKRYNTDSYHQLPMGIRIVDTSLPASSVPEGSQRFTVRVYNRFGSVIKSAYRDYYIEVDYRIELVSPNDYSCIDFDVNEDKEITMSFLVQKSDTITTYIYRPSSAQYIEKDTIDTTYMGPEDNDWDYIFKMSWLENSSLGAIAHEDLCHTACKLKLINEYDTFSQELVVNFRVLWNRAEITVDLQQIYVGDGGWETEIEIFWQWEKMVQNQYYLISKSVGLSQEEIYATYPTWLAEADRIFEYKCGVHGATTDWRRKDSSGDVFSIEQQRRSIRLYDDDPIHQVLTGADDLCHIFYFWLSPSTNPTYHTIELKDEFTGGNVNLDVDGSYQGIYWKVERPDHQWGDFWNLITFYINLFPTRTAY